MANPLLSKLSALTGRSALLAAFGLGVVAALALPPLYAVPALLVAIPGLLALLGGAASWKRAGWIGFAFGWGHHVAGLYWISHALLTDPWRWGWLVPVAVPGLALPLAVYAAVAAIVAWRAAPGWPRWLALAGAWTLLEWARGLLLTGFPWNALGTVWAFDALPLQGAAYVGVYGLSFVTLLVAGTPYLGPRAVAGGAATLAVLAGFGLARLAQPLPEGPGVDILLVQGNVQQEAKWREDQRWPIFRRYLELTRQGVAARGPSERPLAVIWPETASPFLLPQDEAARGYVAQVLPARGMLLGGSVRVDWTPEGKVDHLYNSLSAVDGQGQLRAVYDKAHLVPFGEYMPLRGLIPIRIVEGAGEFAAGPGPVALAPGGGIPPFSPLICYEVIFPAAVSPAERPAWLVNITNDAWFGFSAGPFQHLAASRLRAVEEGLPLARAAQTGVSALFDARGSLAGQIGLGDMATLALPLPGSLPATIFARFGNWGAILLGLLALAVAAAGSSSTMRRHPGGIASNN
ncbi:apolipoprotein N-acyltransferase [Pseudoroseomonas deserti]|uniref:Apolipoprotein N-acyltransferase n=1 Tax=Teichococcus deserti TaxID=1817963 RepID=A0A1V2H1Z5_9PROT|nr:apolipoprotein N-acyltransferase [Pseudoroseomonas deserti]